MLQKYGTLQAVESQLSAPAGGGDQGIDFWRSDFHIVSIFHESMLSSFFGA